MRTPKYLDLRCGRRLTLQEGYTILDALDFAKVPAKGLRMKLVEAITMATHACDRRHGGKCSVCGSTPEQVAALRKRRGDDFRERLEAAKRLDSKLTARARERAMRSPPPRLRLIKGDEHA